MKHIALIMAGGSGERFWPLSRKHQPKQLLTLFSNQTMLSEAVDRITHVIPKEQIFIITGEILKDAIIQALPDIKGIQLHVWRLDMQSYAPDFKYLLVN